MKKVMILEDEYAERGSIADICSQWPDDITIISASDESEASYLVKKNDADVIICDLSSGYGPQIKTLGILTYEFPYIPCLAVINQEQQLEEKALELGAALCMIAPVRPADLRIRIHELLEQSTSGVVRGFPVHSLLQMLEIDAKTCTLKIVKEDSVGLIYLRNGVVVGAEAGNYINEDAVYSIVTWEDATTEIRHYNGQRQHEIKTPLISLIMEAFRLHDERQSITERRQDESRPKLELNHFSTVGNRLSLEIGAAIKMEVEGQDTILMADLVGMVVEQCLIISPPRPVEIARKVLSPDCRIEIKYLHMGRLCMFKTTLQDTVTTPYRLMFLKYPRVVHFHELRRAKRTSIFVPGTLQKNDTDELSGVLIDMSSSGCLFSAKVRNSISLADFDIDADIQLSCLLPGVPENQILPGKVKNIKKTSEELRIGIELVDMEDHLKSAIERYVQSVDRIGQ